jgi:hypothetical protein
MGLSGKAWKETKFKGGKGLETQESLAWPRPRGSGGRKGQGGAREHKNAVLALMKGF